MKRILKKNIRFAPIVLFTGLFAFVLFTGFDSPISFKSLPNGYNDLFAGSGECASCHNSQTDPAGSSVALADDWRSTMMANASRDPFWRAKVSSEVAANPIHKAFIEDKCSKCHAPAGNVNLHHLGGEYYSFADLDSDPLGLDGVQCTVCHQITSGSLGNNSANFTIGTNKIIYGPYPASFGAPMSNATGYTPEYSSHIDDSRLCGTCHTLLTHPVSPEGGVYENEFVEQSVFQEWKNSVYPEEQKSCQSCHVPRIEGPVVISSIPPWLSGQAFFCQHHFAGANVFMNQIFQENASALGLTANQVQLERTKQRTLELLTERAISLSVNEVSRTASSLQIELEVINLSGHKLPTGYPSRRVFIEFIATNEMGDTLLHSGEISPDFMLIGEDPGYEPHHQVISRDNQVQIFEMVMGDISGNPTTELLRAHTQLKDNRLPPKGFRQDHISYDTIRIAGEALDDADFNYQNGLEGSGSDQILYEIPITGQSGQVTVNARVYYQTVSPRWLESTFEKQTVDTELFKDMYENSAIPPVLMTAASFVSRSTQILEASLKEEFLVYPNPATDKIYITYPSDLDVRIELFDLRGKRVILQSTQSGPETFELDVRALQSGIYVLSVQTGKQVAYRKVVVN